tara:strand:+ start:322 stop:864 length:543 start_codon:yes stop_codon:yes gene_type:complete
MIQISKDIQLKKINNSDSESLFILMKEIYSYTYSHFWKDKGDWYINSQYSKENLLKDLSQKKSDYYFIIYKTEIVGNFRIIWDEKLKGWPKEKQVKLHRVYLNQKTHGIGIGKKLISWLEEKAFKKGYQMIWLDAMDAQSQAFKFYKKLGYKYFSHEFLTYNLLYNEVRKMNQFYKVLNN